MIEQRWCTTNGTSWTLSHDKYWANIQLSCDNTSYFATTGSLKDRPPEELSWDGLNKDDWSGDFDCLKRAKESCIWTILNKKEQAEAIASFIPYEGIFDRENYDGITDQPEDEAADWWKEAKDRIIKWTGTLNGVDHPLKCVADYVRHLECQAKVIAISRIGELNQYLIDKEVGVVGDMVAKVALDYIKSLEAELTKRPVVWCVLREGGYMRRRCGCVKTFTDRDKKSSAITETTFRPYTGEQE